MRSTICLLVTISGLLSFPVSSYAESSSQPFTFEKIAGLVASHHVQTPEALLKVLAADAGRGDLLTHDFLASWHLVYSGQSSQGATPMSPRVILHNRDATFLMAFSGDSALDGFDTFEMIQFRDRESKFEFREISFSREGSRPAVISAANPTKCLDCHEQDGRPNWDAYPFWPGIYGSGVSNIKGEQERELRDFKAFEASVSSGQRERYRYLVDLDAFHGSLSGPEHRNSDLSRRLTDLNFKRLVRILRATPDFERFKYAVVYALQNCNPDALENLLPKGVRSGFKMSLPDALRSTADLMKFRSDQVQRESGIYSFYEPARIGQLRYLFENRGVEMISWAMPFESDDFHFTSPDADIQELASALADVDPALERLVGKRKCEQLKAESLKAFSGPGLHSHRMEMERP